MWKADPAPPLRPGVQSDSSYVFLIPSNHGVQETVLEEGPTFWSEELICFVFLSKSLPHVLLQFPHMTVGVGMDEY